MNAVFKIIAGLFLFSSNLSIALAASSLLYFPNDYTSSSGAPANVTNIAEFAPICTDSSDIYEARLPGLDMVRGFASGTMCPVSDAVSNRFSEEAEYIFLVDDTSQLSPYLIAQMRAKNAIQTVNGREVIKPTLINFESDGDREGFKIFVVGETSFDDAAGAEAWFTSLQGRFAPGEVVAGGTNSASGDDEIWFAYHGSFYDKLGRLIENTPVEKIVNYLQKQLENAAGLSPPSPSSGSGLPAPPPLPSRTLNDYMTQCHNNLVPLPPVWNPTSGTSQWTRQGVLADPFSQPSLDLDGDGTRETLVDSAEVWTFTSTNPRGLCYALPRFPSGGNINDNTELLGIICQSAQSGKACFWDNVERPAGVPSSGEADSTRRVAGGARIRAARTRDLDPVNMRDGYNLVENCSDCHRGSNAFLIQIGTPLSSASGRNPSVRYEPISGDPPSPAWINPTSTLQPQVVSASASSQCTSCHGTRNEFPEVTGAYCTTVLGQSIGTNMPPSNSADWANAHLEEVRAISTKCCQLSANLNLADSSGTPLNATCPPTP